MAKVARWTEASLKPEQYNKTTFSSRVDEELSNRIRALLVARSGHSPPKAPCPSPDLASSGFGSDGSYAGYKYITHRSSSISVAQTIAKLSRRDSQDPAMVTSNYNAPAGQIEEIHSNGHRLSQPDTNYDATNLKASALNGLAQRDQADPAYRRSDSLTSQSTTDCPSRAISLSSKRSRRSRLVYNLRTVPPHAFHRREAPSSHEFPHVPGTYESETEAAIPHGFQTPPTIEKTTKPEVYSRAAAALASIRGYDKFNSAQVSKSSLQRPSIATLASSTYTLQSHHPPSDLFIGQSQLSVAAEPIITAEIGEARRYSEGLAPLPRALGYQTSTDKKTQPRPLDTQPQSMNFDGHGKGSSNQALPANPSSQLPASLARTPQTTEHGVDGLEYSNSYCNTELPYSTNDRRATVFYSPEAGNNSSVDPSSIYSKSTSLSDSKKAEATVPNGRNALGRDAETSSIKSQRLPSLNSAMTRKSVISIHAGPQMPSSRSSTQREDDSAVGSSTQLEEDSSKDSSMDQGRVPMSPSFVQRSQISFDIADDVRLLKQANTTGPMDSEPKRHWIRALLRPRSNTSPSQNQSNLTARFTRQNRETVESEPIVNVSKEYHQLNVESTEEKTIKVQEQKATASFTKVVQDLETLLKEALFIARQATDSSGDKRGSVVTGSPVSGRSSIQLAHHSDCSSLSGGSDQEDRYGISEPRQHNNFVKNRDAMLYPGRSVAPTRQSTSLASKMSNVELRRVDSQSSKGDSTPGDDSHISGGVAASTNQSVQLIHQNSSSDFCHIQDWAFRKHLPQSGENFSMPQQPARLQPPLEEQNGFVLRENKPNGNVLKGPVIQPRTSSALLRSTPRDAPRELPKLRFSDEGGEGDFEMRALQPSGRQYRTVTQHTLASMSGRPPREPSFYPSRVNSAEGAPSSPYDPDAKDSGQGSIMKGYSLKNRRHFSVRDGNAFSLSRFHSRAPIARDWSTSRKRYVATVTCINTALMGLVIGIYAGEVPAIQYAIVDEHHYSILGNVVFFLGLAISTAVFWPLPLLHGRKPYTLAALALLLALQIPQALAVGHSRSPYIATYRVGLLLPRAGSGVVVGFASINFKTTLLDLFGASLQSANPHQETVNKNDVRRHGGGMGVWLGIWTWCSIGSIGVGFFLGAVIISALDVDWGFWIVVILTASTLILNVLVPEVRRSAYRRSMAEVRGDREVSRRIARGEIKMHIDSTGPIWWGEELAAGYTLCMRMLKQPGFLILSLYVGWIYGQIVMVIAVSCSPLHAEYSGH